MANLTEIQTDKRLVREAPRETSIVREVDVLVCGGGQSGIGAAIGAARGGAKTLLIERNAWLGGPATAALMNTWNVPVDKMTGIAKEIALSLHQKGAGIISGPTFPFDPEAYKGLAVDLIEQAGAEILTYTWVVDPIMEDKRIRGVMVQNKSGRQAILADVVVDTTGDADVACAAGADHVKGRESDGKMRPMSVLFRIGGVDVAQAVEYCRANPENFTADPNFHILDPENGLVRMSGFFDIADRARAARELPDEVHYIRMEGISVERGVVMVNNSRVYGVDGTNGWDISRGDLEARRQNAMIFDVIRQYIPGFESSWIMDSSSSVGVRETRRIRGPELLEETHLLGKQDWDESVVKIWRHMAAGKDWHKADGGEGSTSDTVYRTGTTDLTWFQIPWGVFTPNNVDGLLVGGRTLSVTHAADMWTRGQYCCLVTGQVAGISAALAAEQDIMPAQLTITELQERISKQGIDTK